MNWFFASTDSEDIAHGRKGIRSLVHTARNEAAKSIHNARQGKRRADEAHEKSMNVIKSITTMRENAENELFARMMRNMRDDDNKD
jgi:hypothetical protein